MDLRGNARRGDIGGRARRRALTLTCVNAAMWAIGNGLVSSTLIVYLALGVGARNFQTSVIYAFPFLAGILRLAVPAILARCGHRKTFCIGSYVVSACVRARSGDLRPAETLGVRCRSTPATQTVN